MTNTRSSDTTPVLDATEAVVPCDDLGAAIALYTGQRGFRLDMIMPADAPRIALVSRDGTTLRLEAIRDGGSTDATDGDAQAFVLCRADGHDAWPEGRAGMQYRDLIPGRLGGRLIASHIRIPDAGPVPDYVHYHKVGFQMIYCRRGWVRVVYEDQGPPFTMQAGDCVLQPPTIRHRVLESSRGLEVIEVGSPAVHETWRDHELELPTSHRRPERLFGGQRFVHHVAANAVWQGTKDRGFEFRDTGIADASDGVASVRVVRAATGTDAGSRSPTLHSREGEVVFLYVLEGEAKLRSAAFGNHTLRTDDACAIPAGAPFVVEASTPCEMLEVVMNFAS